MNYKYTGIALANEKIEVWERSSVETLTQIPSTCILNLDKYLNVRR